MKRGFLNVGSKRGGARAGARRPRGASNRVEGEGSRTAAGGARAGAGAPLGVPHRAGAGAPVENVNAAGSHRAGAGAPVGEPHRAGAGAPIENQNAAGPHRPAPEKPAQIAYDKKVGDLQKSANCAEDPFDVPILEDDQTKAMKAIAASSSSYITQ